MCSVGVLDQNILGRRQDLPDGVNEIGFTGVTFFFAHFARVRDLVDTFSHSPLLQPARQALPTQSKDKEKNGKVEIAFQIT